MGKLFNLKKWLTVADAARHLSIIFGEDVTEADVLRLGLDKRLRLSVYFVNHTVARCGKVVRYTDEELAASDLDCLDGLRWTMLPVNLFEPDGEKRLVLMSINVGQDLYLTLSDDVVTLTGVYDLPMIGGERLDIEHEYQNLTGGPAVTLLSLDGAFVEGRDGQMCQLQESNDDNEYTAGSNAQLESLNQHIAANGIKGAEAELLLNQHRERRKKFLKKTRTKPKKDNYYQAGGISRDAVIVVRTEALREFEQSINSATAHIEDNEKEKYLKQIASLAYLLTEKSNLYKQGSRPNASQIAEAVQAMLDALPDANKRGLGKSNIRDSISKGMKLLDK